ncbi:hypothetical protein, partial [Pseudomonas aeruginosa]
HQFRPQFLNTQAPTIQSSIAPPAKAASTNMTVNQSIQSGFVTSAGGTIATSDLQIGSLDQRF